MYFVESANLFRGVFIERRERIRMKSTSIMMLLVAAIAASASPAQAVLHVVVQDNGNLVQDVDFDPDFGFFFDIHWTNTLPVTLELTLEDVDVIDNLGLLLINHNGIHPDNPGNLAQPGSGPAWSDYHMLIVGDAAFLDAGLVFADTALGPPDSIDQQLAELNVFFNPLEVSGVAFIATAIDLSLLSTGEAFQLIIMPTLPLNGAAVPEPATAIALFGAIATMTRRRRPAMAC